MTRHEKVVVLKRQIHTDHSIIRFWRNHPPLIVENGELAKTQTHWAKVSLKIASRSLRKLTYHNAMSGSDMSAWLCIHRYEGAWNDPNPPYWGGLQMDLTFQRTYGSEFMRRYGTADHWPIIDQIIAARRARDSGRGYSPWPNTASLCGLM